MSNQILQENKQLVSDIKSECGQSFQELSNSDKIWIISYILKITAVSKNSNPNDDIVTYDDKIELAKTLINELNNKQV